MIKLDVDRPSTWRKYTSTELCNTCNANCCTMPVEVTLSDLIRLNLVREDEVSNLTVKRIAKRLIKEKWITSYREATGLFMLNQKANRDCVFLDSKTRKCTRYSLRPDVCRQFPSIGPRPSFCPYDSTEKRP